MFINTNKQYNPYSISRVNCKSYPRAEEKIKRGENKNISHRNHPYLKGRKSHQLATIQAQYKHQA
jgi:hypothetical protein